jgi:hypothetical protein
VRKWFDQQDLWGKGSSHVFAASRSRNKFDFKKTASGTWFRGRIKREVDKVGLDPHYYSGHSFRAGGATDLFVARVPYPIIKKKGRWLSDVAMVYYRDDDDIEEAVGEAFKRISTDVGVGGGGGPRGRPAGYSPFAKQIFLPPLR